MIMKTRYFKLVTVCLLAVSLFASCLGDLDTLPLDDNELTGEMVYSTPEGYIGMIAKCYAALIQTGQKGGDGESTSQALFSGLIGRDREGASGCI